MWKNNTIALLNLLSYSLCFSITFSCVQPQWSVWTYWYRMVLIMRYDAIEIITGWCACCRGALFYLTHFVSHFPPLFQFVKSRRLRILFHYIVGFYSPYLKKPLGSCIYCISVNVIVLVIIHYSKALEIFSFGPQTHITSNKHCSLHVEVSQVYTPIVFFLGRQYEDYCYTLRLSSCPQRKIVRTDSDLANETKLSYGMPTKQFCYCFACWWSRHTRLLCELNHIFPWKCLRSIANFI